MKDEEIEYLRGITAYDFLNETETDGKEFIYRVVINFLRIKFTNNSLKSLDKDITLWLSPALLKQMKKTDKALEELFDTYKKGYKDNLPKN